MQLNSSYSYKSTSAALEAPEPHIKQCDNNIGLCQPFQPFMSQFSFAGRSEPGVPTPPGGPGPVFWTWEAMLSGRPIPRSWDLGSHAAGCSSSRFWHSGSRETGSIVV